MKAQILLLALAGMAAGTLAATGVHNEELTLTSVGPIQPVQMPPRVTVVNDHPDAVTIWSTTPGGERHEILGTVPSLATRTFDLDRTGELMQLLAQPADALGYPYQSPPLEVGDMTVVELLLGRSIHDSQIRVSELDVAGWME